MIYVKFLVSLLRHKRYVLRAGRSCGVPLWRCVIHDWSKFTPSEFTRYARNFVGDYTSSPNDRAQVSLEFTYAWLHHENRNPHHWGYWIPRTGKSAGKPLPMPEKYVREMVADFLSASKTYTGNWNIALWLNENGPRMILHEETHARLVDVLLELKYACTDNCDWSWVRC